MPPAAVAAGEVDAGVRGGVALEGGDDLGVGGAVVDQAELPVGEGLGADRGDRLLEHVRGGSWTGVSTEISGPSDERLTVGRRGPMPVELRAGSSATRRGSAISGATQAARATNGPVPELRGPTPSFSEVLVDAGTSQSTVRPFGLPLCSPAAKSEPDQSVRSDARRRQSRRPMSEARRRRRANHAAAVSPGREPTAPASRNGIVTTEPADCTSARPVSPSGSTDQSCLGRALVERNPQRRQRELGDRNSARCAVDAPPGSRRHPLPSGSLRLPAHRVCAGNKAHSPYPDRPLVHRPRGTRRRATECFATRSGWVSRQLSECNTSVST